VPLGLGLGLKRPLAEFR